MPKDLIDQLITYRLKRKLSQPQLAKKLGVTFQTVNRWLNRHMKPSQIHRYHISKLLKSNRLSIILAGSLLLANPVHAETDTVTRIAKESTAGVVTILALDKQGNLFSQGTGFLASSDGVIVTCHHVVADAGFLAVKLPDGDVYDEVGVIELDPRRDIAVLKIKATGLHGLTEGDSNDVEIGQ